MSANHELFMQTNDRLEGLLEELGLTPATAQLLWLIIPGGVSRPLKELSQRMHCNASNLTYVADQLAIRGLIERRTDPSDRRFKALALTSTGRDVREELVTRARHLTPLHAATTDELHQLTHLIGSILDRANDERHGR